MPEDAGHRLTVPDASEGIGVRDFLRDYLPLEPVEFMTNAFNRPERTADIRLSSGASRAFRFAVEVSG